MLDTFTSEDGQLILIPDTLVVTLWRNILSTIYIHPPLLMHSDMNELRAIFVENNVIHENCEANIFIPLPGLDKSTFNLRPPITFPNSTLQLIFGQILNFDISDAGITIRGYRLCSTVKTAVSELAEFIRIYPRGIYGDEFGFIYDFLVRFGISPKVIESLLPLPKRQVLIPKSSVNRQISTQKQSVLKRKPVLKNGLDQPRHIEPALSRPSPSAQRLRNIAASRSVTSNRKRKNNPTDPKLPTTRMKRMRSTAPSDPEPQPSAIPPTDSAQHVSNDVQLFEKVTIESKNPEPPQVPPQQPIPTTSLALPTLQINIPPEDAKLLFNCRVVLERICIP